MIIYNIALTVALTILAMTLYFVVDYFKDKTKELEDKIIKLRIKNHTTGFTLQRLDDTINMLIDKVYKPQKVKDSADKQVGVGKWIRIETKTRYWYGCSCCHTKAPKNDYGNDYFSSYCPECGAKMEVDE